jgi:hypothetical protein
MDEEKSERYPIIPIEDRRPIGWLFSEARLAELRAASCYPRVT